MVGPARLKLGLGLSLPTRLPFGLRAFFRGAFLALAAATLALALGVLADEKQRGQRAYAEGLKKTAAQAAARLRHPAGQLALLNPGTAEGPALPPRPLLLPFAAIDFDDRNKARQAVETAGCALQYPGGATLCVAMGSNPFAGGFVYVVLGLGSEAWVPHTPGQRDLAPAHRLEITLDWRGRRWPWVAAYELAADGRGRLVGFEGFDGSAPLPHGTRPQREFRGWVWQEGRCAAGAAPEAAPCRRPTFVSLRLPVEPLREALAAGPAVWPPPDFGGMALHLRVRAPGAEAPLFDSRTPGATLPFTAADLREGMAPGERLSVRREGADADTLVVHGDAQAGEPVSPWIAQIIRRLPGDAGGVPAFARESAMTPLGRFDIELRGDARGVDQRLAAVATRLSGFVGAMLAAVLVTWLALEVRLIRRMTLLTRRAAALSSGVRREDGSGDELAALDLADLRGRDELGVLAQGLKDLLARVNEDLRRGRIRAQQERDQWHAVGHEILSPLQSLMVLHGREGDPAARYITRMQQAVRVLYGQASPSEAFASTELTLATLDLRAFLGDVAANAVHIGIEDVQCEAPEAAVPVRADEHALEDVFAHLLRNAARHRRPGTPVRLQLQADATLATVTVHNEGEPIAPELLERLFEYGVTGAVAGANDGRRGQGLFVARTYLAKMGGTLAAANVAGGVAFTLTLRRAPP